MLYNINAILKRAILRIIIKIIFDFIESLYTNNVPTRIQYLCYKL